jgi:Ca2+/Na+ antiporter
MEIYLSPVYIITLGIFIVGIFSTLKLPNALIASIALVLVVYTLYLHVYMYSTEYRVMSSAAWVKQLAPNLITVVVVLMAVAYIIFFFKKDRPKTSEASFNPLSIFSPKKTSQSLDGDRYNSEGRQSKVSIDRLI